MKTIILSYVIALGGVAMIVVGLTIAVGFVLIGLARALQLLLLIFAAS